MTESIAERKLKFALRLFELGAVKFGDFDLKLHEHHPDAPLSPFFLNLRSKDNQKSGELGVNEYLQAAELMFRIGVRERGLVNFTHIAGIPNAGDPFAQVFHCVACEADQTHYELLRLSKVSLPDGKRRIGKAIGGSDEYTSTDRVLLIDDLITMAHTKLEAIKSIMDLGVNIAGLIVLVDREQGGAKQIADAGYDFVSVYTLTELLGIYVDKGLINDARRARCLGYQEELNAYFADKAQTG
jgi:orotate phosphoribosyltransferase